jgi:FkbM family methyltransferase
VFSWDYLKNAAASSIRSPAALIARLRGEDAGEVFHRKRMREWMETRQRYSDEPRETFGFKIYLNPNDMSQASASIAATGWLNLPVTCLFLKVLRSGMSVVDVGANLGYYTLLAAKKVEPGGRVWAFEPEARNFQLMMRSIGANDFHNIEPVQAALSVREGTEELFLAPPAEPNAHTLTQDRGLGSVRVSSMSLDDFWEDRAAGRRLDLLKVHVFGDDAMVLGGARQVLKTSRPMIITRFVASRWKKGETDEGLLDDLFSIYKVYEIIDSPSLIKPIQRSTLERERVNVGIFLTPWEDRSG